MDFMPFIPRHHNFVYGNTFYGTGILWNRFKKQIPSILILMIFERIKRMAPIGSKCQNTLLIKMNQINKHLLDFTEKTRSFMYGSTNNDKFRPWAFPLARLGDKKARTQHQNYK